MDVVMGVVELVRVVVHPVVDVVNVLDLVNSRDVSLVSTSVILGHTRVISREAVNLDVVPWRVVFVPGGPMVGTAKNLVVSVVDVPLNQVDCLEVVVNTVVDAS
jgi:hypothetical protein